LAFFLTCFFAAIAAGAGQHRPEQALAWLWDTAACGKINCVACVQTFVEYLVILQLASIR
jgi:hypothetical protein